MMQPDRAWAFLALWIDVLFPEALHWECQHLCWYVGLQCQKGDVEALCACL